MFIILLVAAVACVTARPPGPPENPDYLHTVNLQYDGSQLMGLNQIEGFGDVDPAMQASLKKAIEEAWPSYYTDMLQQPAASPAVSGSTAQPELVQTSTASVNSASSIVSSFPSTTVAAASVASTTPGATASTPVNHTGSTPSAPHRFRRQASTVAAVAVTSTTPQPVIAIQPTNPTPVPLETTTDFWSRTDLVHFKINFNPFSIVTTDVPANAVSTARP